MNKGLKLSILLSCLLHRFLKRNTDLMNKGLKLYWHIFSFPDKKKEKKH